MQSIVAEIGHAIERHMQMIGMITTDNLDDHQKEFLAKKKAEIEAAQNASDGESDNGEFPASASVCSKCSTKSLVLMDGCMTCLSCGDSKCG